LKQNSVKKIFYSLYGKPNPLIALL